MQKELYFEDLSEFWLYSFRESSARIKSSRRESDKDWFGGVSWSKAKILAKKGWDEGLVEIEKYRARIIPKITDKVLRPMPVYAVAGYNVDVGTFLSNNPECFLTREFEERNYPGRIFKIVCSISFSASITPETIIQRGAMVCALVDAIEYAGHRAEVISNVAFSGWDSEEARLGKNKTYGWFEVSVVVKKASQPLEMSDLAFCLAHPAMLRRMMFSVAELNGWSDRFSNYGYPAEATDKGDLYIREVFSRRVSDDRAIDWVLAEMEKLGINIERDSTP